MTVRQQMPLDQRMRRHSLAGDPPQPAVTATQPGAIGGARPPSTSAPRALADPRGLTPATVLRLQHLVGNRATGRVVARWVASVSPAAVGHVIQRVKNEKDVYEMKKREEGAFLREILDGLECDQWRFPKQSSGDGILGRNCISEGVVYRVPRAKKGISYHVNFMISSGTMTKSTPARRGRLALSLRLLHLTARTDGTQALIADNGPSILTAAKSIHCGPGNDWDWGDARARELATDLGCELADLQLAVANAGLGMRSMAALKGRLQTAIATTVTGNLPQIDIEWAALDNTWA